MLTVSHSPTLCMNFGKLLKSQVRFGGQIRMAIENGESRGALIVLEGLDRSGKSLQCGRLVRWLEGLGHSAELWRFPDRNTNVGQMISSYLNNNSQLDDHTIHLLFSANRWEKRSLMETKLKTGTTLIVDRYSYSGVAFSSAKGLAIEWCKAPEIGLLAPDLVVYLDIQPEGIILVEDEPDALTDTLVYTLHIPYSLPKCMHTHTHIHTDLHTSRTQTSFQNLQKAAERGGYGGERYEQLEFQKKVAKCYQVLHDASWKIIDACQPIEDIEKQLQEIVLDCVKTCQKGKPLSNLWSG